MKQTGATILKHDTNTILDYLSSSFWQNCNSEIFSRLDDLILQRQDTYFWVCLSWGPDSIYLLIHLRHRCILHAIDPSEHVVVFHYMHHVRQDDCIDWEFITGLASYCRVCSASYTGEDDREAALRDARWWWMTSCGGVVGCGYLFTWHTLTDRIETSLINAIRWCSDIWRNAMRANGVLINRPLLDTVKSDILAWLDDHEIPYLIDPTNIDPEISERNRLRKLLWPSLQSQWWVGLKRWMKFYDMLEVNLETISAPISMKPCTVHPDRWNGVFVRLDNIDSLTLDSIVSTLGLSLYFGASKELERQSFVVWSGLWWFSIWGDWILRCWSGLYYTSLNKNFWKKECITYARCIWNNHWRAVNTSDLWQGQKILDRMKDHSVPVFWRSCLPVVGETHTLTAIYSLDALIW